MPETEAQSPQSDFPWRGCPPAEGTRRKLIADVLRAQDVLSETEVREFADAVESALLQATIDAEAMERGAEILTRGIEKVDPTESKPPPDEFDCALAACERLYERLTEGPVPNCAELARTIDILRHGSR